MKPPKNTLLYFSMVKAYGGPDDEDMDHRARRLFWMCREIEYQYLLLHGLSRLDIGGAGMVLLSVDIDLFVKCRHGELLEITLKPKLVDDRAWAIHYEIRNMETRMPVARIVNTFRCYDYSRHSEVNVPDSLKHKLVA